MMHQRQALFLIVAGGSPAGHPATDGLARDSSPADNGRRLSATLMWEPLR